MPQYRHIAFLSLALLAAGPVCAAAPYPERSIRLIVPFPPGGGTDALSRILAPKLTEYLGQQVLVDNRGGAQGTVGTALGAKAAPDGYTMLFAHSGALTINPHMYSRLSYDTLKNFAAVSRGTEMPYILVLHPSVPAKSMQELAQLARSRPGELTFASTSAGPQLMGELFRLTTKTKMVHVPYKGAGPALTDLLGGHVGIMFTVPTSVGPHIRSGKLRALGVSGPKREESLPDIPTMTEAGFSDFGQAREWYGFVVPSGTPAEAVTKLNAALVRALNDADVHKRLHPLAQKAVPSTPAEFGDYIRSQYALWGKVVKATGAKVD
ncbi:MAG: tripartite tricarboxylate transporter substrate binding protein [Betaproteobacteria bacterium]|nr:tripartite tricarboxylate transporter substrate binding protein [Betaproteobacteria bacterium]